MRYSTILKNIYIYLHILYDVKQQKLISNSISIVLIHSILCIINGNRLDGKTVLFNKIIVLLFNLFFTGQMAPLLYFYHPDFLLFDGFS